MNAKGLVWIALAVALSACASLPTPPALPVPNSLSVPTLPPAPTPLGPVSAPTETIVPSPTLASPTQAISAGPTQSASGANSACSNAFYPVAPNAQWTYRATTSQAPSSSANYEVTISNVTASSFTEHRAFDGTNVDDTWTCSSDGLASTQFGNLHVHGITGFQFSTTQNTGITIPPADQWAIGKTWTSGYDIQGQLQQNGVNLSGTGTVDIQNKIAAEEQVTVPAGAFTAFRVDSIITLNLTPTGSVPIPIKLTLNQSSWYARDTGLVKSTLNMNSQTATTELVSYQP